MMQEPTPQQLQQDFALSRLVNDPTMRPVYEWLVGRYQVAVDKLVTGQHTANSIFGAQFAANELRTLIRDIDAAGQRHPAARMSGGSSAVISGNPGVQGVQAHGPGWGQTGVNSNGFA